MIYIKITKLSQNSQTALLLKFLQNTCVYIYIQQFCSRSINSFFTNSLLILVVIFICIVGQYILILYYKMYFKQCLVVNKTNLVSHTSQQAIWLMASFGLLCLELLFSHHSYHNYLKLKCLLSHHHQYLFSNLCIYYLN